MPDEIAEAIALGVTAPATQETARPTMHGVVPPGLQPCEFRWERAAAGEARGRREIVCMAAAGKRVALAGGDEHEMRSICGSCTIPTEAARRPCLFLVPIKTERDHRSRDYFACRWFYTLKPEMPPTSTDWMCGGCPYWFPRPPIELLTDLEKATRAIIRYHQDAWAGRLPPSHFASWMVSPPAPISRWRRVLDRLAGWIC